MSVIKCGQCGRVLAPAETSQPCPNCGSVEREVLADAPVVESPPVTPSTPGRPRRRRRWPVVVALISLAVVLGALAWNKFADRRNSKRLNEAAELSRQSETAIREGKYRDALARADEAIQTAPDYAAGYARRARARYFLGDEEGALADCDEAIRRDPGLGVAYTYRAPVAWLRAAPAAGVRDGERAVELVPDSAEVFACLALAKVQAGDVAGAVQVAGKAIELNAEDAEAHRARGLALAAQNAEQARGEFDAAVRLSSDRPFYLVARADYLVHRARSLADEAEAKALSQATDDANRAIAGDPDFAPAYVVLAQVSAHRERRFDVLASCQKAVAANPRYVPAYLRAAEELSPRDLRRFHALQEALTQPLDLRELKGGGDFAFGSMVSDLQRLVSGKRKQDVPVTINYHSFPEAARATLRDARINLNSIMDVSGENLLRSVSFKTVLDTLCRQVGASFWVTPEHIEIVARESAQAEAARRPRLVAYDVIAPIDLHLREQRVLFFEQALQQTLDLRELRGGGDFAAGPILTDLQRLVSSKMRADVTVYFNYESFDPKTRATLRDSRVNLNVLMDASGENLLTAVKYWKVLDDVVRHLGRDAKVRVSPDYIEVVWTGQSEGGEAAWRPLRLKGKPRTEADHWLSRGIEQVPDSARLRLARGQVYLEMFDAEAAIADLTKAIELNPGDTRAYRLRSIAYTVRGQPGDAALARADALATKP